MTKKANEVRRVRRTNALQTDQPTDRDSEVLCRTLKW